MNQVTLPWAEETFSCRELLFRLLHLSYICFCKDCLKMAGRRSDREEWDVHKNEIDRSYIEDDRKLSEVIAMMT
jgi:hypothetical protein